MKKIMKSIIICILLAFVLNVSGKENSLEALAAGNSMSDAMGISIGRTYSGSITDSNSEDFYRFEINSSGRVKLLAKAGMYEIYYYIYDSKGNRVWYTDPEWNSATKLITTNEYIDLTKGTYYFLVEKRGSYTGDYSFELTFNSANESFIETGFGSDNKLVTANNISINTKYNGQIAVNDVIDVYKFTLPSSGRINLVMTRTMYSIAYLIYDNEEKCLYAEEQDPDLDESFSIDLTKGTYYFAVKGVEDTGNYSFELVFTSAKESFVETGDGNNNSLLTANNIMLNKWYYGHLAKNDPIDFYEFTIKSATQISFMVKDWSSYTFYDKWGNKLLGGSGSNVSKQYQMIAGTYYVSFEGGTGSYAFKIQTSSGSTVKKKTPTIKVSRKTAVYRATKVRRASQTFKIGARVSGNGKITYKKLSGSSKLVVGKNGKVTVRKGTKKGTYKAVVQIKAAESSKYKARTVRITVTVKVK